MTTTRLLLLIISVVLGVGKLGAIAEAVLDNHAKDVLLHIIGAALFAFLIYHAFHSSLA